MTDDPRLPVECLALATGLFPTHPPTPAETRRAANLHARATTAIRAFLREPTAAPVTWERPSEQEALHADLLAPVEKDEWQASHLPVEMLPQWLLVLSTARRYAADKWPIFDATALTPANYSLSTDELGDLWEIVRALDGTEAFFSDLKAHCLSPAAVLAVKTAYPAWYASLDHILFDELVSFASAKKTLSWQQEDMLRVLRGLGEDAPISAPPAPPPAAKSSSSATPKSVLQLRSRDERMEATALEGK